MRPDRTPLNTDGFEYDFVISYAGEDVGYARSLHEQLAERGAVVFFSPERKAESWGEPLPEYLAEVYSQKGRFCIPLISQHYVDKQWTRHEWRSAQARALQDVDNTYILPVRIDAAILPGLLSTIAYFDINEGAEAIAQTALEKLYALDPLRSVFPRHWDITRLPNVDSKDAGETWLVQIVDSPGNARRGAFHLFRRVTKQKRVRRRIGMKLRPSTIRYLHETPTPVMLCLFHTGNKRSYWRWLEDIDWAEAAKQQKSVSIHIPTQNVLSTDLSRIISHVERAHVAQLLRKQTEIAVDPDFDYRFHSDKHGFGVSVLARHDKALDNHPVEAKITLGHEAYKNFLRTLELGEETEFEGKVSFEGLPNWLVPEEALQTTITIQPLTPDMRAYTRIECLDKMGETILTSDFVEFHLVQSGSKYKKWQGKASRQPIFYSITLDAVNQRTNFTLNPDSEIRNPVEINWYLETLERMQNVNDIRLTNLETGKAHTLRYAGNIVINKLWSEPIVEFIRNLATIVTRLGIDIAMPDQVTNDDVATTNMVAEIIRTGKTSQLTAIPAEIRNSGNPPVFMGSFPLGEVQPILDTLDEDGEVYLKSPVKADFDLFGHRINLGPSYFVFYGKQLLNRTEVEKTLRDSQHKVDVVELQLLGTVEQSYASFSDWEQEDND